ncbi:HTH-type transcriptional repressor RspR [Methylobacterium jeotgali]|uniref:HTH-type transcriptional repressor RspR n=3 Tax=Pseudomonadota TaxID=1224 RepID=A0ABQ4T095_9HYPH|nr:transcriptional regulator [Methylobacterium sp.]GJE07434.1 HTH-type transcriptional repressor RspR [Methylobacterium jeotgali]
MALKDTQMSLRVVPAYEVEAEAPEGGLLSDRIRNALTDAIAAGHLASGTALDEQEIADRYGASRTPVREALRQLAHGGLVELRPRRGAVVARLTRERIMDMFETTAEIEATCARLATYRMTPLERSRLIELHAASEPHVAAGDYDAYDALNRAFHETIYAATHNAFMAEQTLALRTRLSAFRRTQLRDEARLPRSRVEHGEILAAMAEGDGEAAARRMRAHMLNAAGALGRYIAEHTG